MTHSDPTWPTLWFYDIKQHYATHSSRKSWPPAAMRDSLWRVPTPGPHFWAAAAWNPTPGLCFWAVAARKWCLSHLHPGSSSREECRLLGWLKGLGKCSPAVSCQHSSPSAFPKVSAENPFLFLSVQTRTMNSSSPQECDKVPTKPTRKVMYGL